MGLVYVGCLGILSFESPQSLCVDFIGIGYHSCLESNRFKW